MSEIPEDIRRAAKNALQSAKNRRHPVASLVPDNLIIDEIEGAILAERVAQMDNAKAAHVSITLANAEIERLNGVVKTLSDELDLAEEEGCDTDDTIRTQSVTIASLVEENRRLREERDQANSAWSVCNNARNASRLRAEKAEAERDAAREFVKRHPSLSLIDLAEFEAFLKAPAMIDAALSKAGA